MLSPGGVELVRDLYGIRVLEVGALAVDFDHADDCADGRHHLLVAQELEGHDAILVHLAAKLRKLLILAAGDVLHQWHHPPKTKRDLLEHERVAVAEDVGERAQHGSEQPSAEVEL